MLKRLTQIYHDDRFWFRAVGPGLVAWLGLQAILGRLGVGHILFVGSMLAMNYIPKTRWVFRCVFPCMFTVLSYDTLAIITPYAHALIPPYVKEPYLIEKALFGIPDGQGGKMILCEFFQTHTSIWLDLPSAFAYFFYIFEVGIMALVLAVRRDERALRFSFAFMAFNYMGYLTYYTFPAAPPWYVELHGLGPAMLDAAPSAARLADIDVILGINYFTEFYKNAPNVFAAVPSLHAAFPMICVVYAKTRAAKIATVTYWLMVCFGAVYLRHHYIIDLVLGSFYAWLGYRLVEYLYRRLQRA